MREIKVFLSANKNQFPEPHGDGDWFNIDVHRGLYGRGWPDDWCAWITFSPLSINDRVSWISTVVWVMHVMVVIWLYRSMMAVNVLLIRSCGMLLDSFS